MSEKLIQITQRCVAFLLSRSRVSVYKNCCKGDGRMKLEDLPCNVPYTLKHESPVHVPTLEAALNGSLQLVSIAELHL
jgi:hypothetical protein